MQAYYVVWVQLPPHFDVHLPRECIPELPLIPPIKHLPERRRRAAGTGWVEKTRVIRTEVGWESERGLLRARDDYCIPLQLTVTEAPRVWHVIPMRNIHPVPIQEPYAV